MWVRDGPPRCSSPTQSLAPVVEVTYAVTDPIDMSEQILLQIRDEMRGMRSELGGMRSELVGVKAELHEMRLEHNDRLERLERHAMSTNELLGMMHERMVFIERAAKVATESRGNLEGRVSRLERRMDALESDDDQR